MSMKIYSVYDPEFKEYGRVVDGYDYTELLKKLDEVSPCPEDGTVYVPGRQRRDFPSGKTAGDCGWKD